MLMSVARKLRKRGSTESPLAPSFSRKGIFGKIYKKGQEPDGYVPTVISGMRGAILKKSIPQPPPEMSPEEFFKRHSINLPVDEQEAKKRMAKTGRKTGPSSAGL